MGIGPRTPIPSGMSGEVGSGRKAEQSDPFGIELPFGCVMPDQAQGSHSERLSVVFVLAVTTTSGYSEADSRIPQAMSEEVAELAVQKATLDNAVAITKQEATCDY